MLFALAMLVSTMLFLPYRRTEDNILAVAAILLLLLTYFGGVLVKVFQDITIHDGDNEFASEVLGIDSINGIVVMVLVFGFTLLIVIAVTIRKALREEHRVQTLRLKATGLAPSLVLAKGHRWMLFLSHVSVLPGTRAHVRWAHCHLATSNATNGELTLWLTGVGHRPGSNGNREAAAAANAAWNPLLSRRTLAASKRSVFLPDSCASLSPLLTLLPRPNRAAQVDDLKSIGELETYVEQSACMLFFLSVGYLTRCGAGGKATPVCAVHT